MLLFALFLAIASVANAAVANLRAGASADNTNQRLQSVISAQADKFRELASFLRQLKNDPETRNLQSDLFVDFDFGSLGMCVGGEFSLDFGNGGRCWCKLSSSSDRLNERREIITIDDIVRHAAFVIDNGIDVEYGCNMPEICETYLTEPFECIMNELSCHMKFDIENLQNNSIECETCAKYGLNSNTGRRTMMTGKRLCMKMDLCMSNFTPEQRPSPSTFLCQNTCTAMLHGRTCECSISECGVAFNCNGLESTCADSGLELLNAGDISSLVRASKFAPHFTDVDATDSHDGHRQRGLRH